MIRRAEGAQVRRVTRAVALAAAVALLGSACGSSGDNGHDNRRGGATAEASDDVPRRADADLVIWGTAANARALQTAMRAFGAEHGVSVAVQEVDGDRLASFIAANAAGTGPDVVIGAHHWIGSLVQNGSIDPLPLSEADQSRYSPAALAAVTYDDLYGLPYAVEALALYRNTDLVPEAPATVEELVASAARTPSKQPLCLPVGEDGDAYHLQPLYASAGGYVFGRTPEGRPDPVDVGVGKPGSLLAADKLAELGAAGVLSTTVTGENAVPMFLAGDCPFLVAGPTALDALRSAGASYAVSAVPGFNGLEPAQPFTDARAFFVASKGADRRLAQEFVLDAANSPATMRALFDAERRPPAMTEVLDVVRDTDPDVATLAAIAAQGLVRPAVPQMAAVWEPLGHAQAAIIRGADPATTMEDAGELIADALN
jgi:arabinogalactan oligomer/maltooligosaccharide transport system substrate-binding protein